MNALVVVQARTGSSRFPSKVLANLAGRPMLEFMLERLRSLAADKLVVATTEKTEDDAVVAIAESAHIAVIRGPEQDVLQRFIVALNQYPAEHVVRLTADCPLIDPLVVNEAIAEHLLRGADYTSNSLVRTYPDGLDVEIVSAKALRAAAFEAQDIVEREHVTPFVYRRPERFTLASVRQNRLCGNERWTVDLPEDLDIIERAVAGLNGRIDAQWLEILDVIGVRAEREPIRPVRACDIQALVDLNGAPDALRAGNTLGSELRVQLEQTLIEPSMRAWSIVDREAVVGLLLLTVVSGVGALSVLLRPSASTMLESTVRALQRCLKADHQYRVVMMSRVPLGLQAAFVAANFNARQDHMTWDRT